MSLFTALAIVGTAASFQQQARQARFQKEATQVQIRQQQAQTSRERRGAVRRGLIARARAANVAATTGMAETSAFLGGSGAVSSQVGSNLGFSGMMSGLSQDITRLSGLASEAGGRAALFGQIGSLGMQLGGADFGAALKGIQGFGSQGRANRAMDRHYSRNQII
tara:strand:+ start:43 stop:537 length:495 start_codon:yes stop_codon:yes gene_type:complete